MTGRCFCIHYNITILQIFVFLKRKLTESSFTCLLYKTANYLKVAVSQSVNSLVIISTLKVNQFGEIRPSIPVMVEGGGGGSSFTEPQS